MSHYAKFDWSRLTRSWLKVCVYFIIIIIILLFDSDYSVLVQLVFGFAWLGCDKNRCPSIFITSPALILAVLSGEPGDRGMAEPTAQGVVFNMQTGSEPVPFAMRKFAKVIVMRAVGIVH